MHSEVRRGRYFDKIPFHLHLSFIHFSSPLSLPKTQSSNTKGEGNDKRPPKLSINMDPCS